MKRTWSYFLLFALSGLVAFAGCKKKPAPQTAKKQKVPKRSATATKGGSWVVQAYEVVRKALAADDLNTAKKGAAALAKQAVGKASYKGMATAATTLASATDIAAARMAFGELSKQAITVLSSGAKTGLIAYQCPMAKGYKKWIQADANMANPYMGKKMLKCGGKTKLTP